MDLRQLWGRRERAVDRPAMRQTVKAQSLPVSTMERYDAPDYSVVENQLKAYGVLSWVADAVGHVSRYAATTPLEVMQLTGDDKEGIVNHPFELLMYRPNPTASRFRLLEATFANLKLAGNAYWWLNTTGETATPIEMFVLPSHRVKVVPGAAIGEISHYLWHAGQGREVKLEQWEIVHFADYHPLNMFSGLSWVEQVGKSVEKDSKAETYDLNFYAKDYAKPEGVLGINGNFTEDDMEAFIARLERKHGGTKRALAVMSHAESLNYIQIAANYADMEFIANREFTRDQIYNHFAPGLPSILSVNSTEANSRTGKATLMEFGVHPLLTSVQETITNRLLPLYGDDLICEFEDVRLSDTAMELSEQQEFAKVHTVNEVRQKYYNDEPLPPDDERGEMFIVQIGQSSIRVNENVDFVPGGDISSDMLPSGSVVTGETAGGSTAETTGQSEGALIKATPLKLEDPTPPPSPVYDELKTWQRFVLKRIKAGKSLREFNSEYIPASLKGAIEGWLEGMQNAEEAGRVFADALMWEAYP